ncbi:MAG: DUF4367 domain-containing protein, partial [Mahellales bacterium]
MSQETMDDILKRSLKGARLNEEIPIPVTGKSAVWEGISRQLAEKKKRKKYSTVIKMGVVAAVVLFLLSGIVSIQFNFSGADAFDTGVLGAIQQLAGNTLKLFIGSEGNNSEVENIDKEMHYSLSESEMNDFDETQQLAGFRVLRPTYLPQGFKLTLLETMTYGEVDDDSKVVYYIFSDAEKYINVQQRLFDGNAKGNANTKVVDDYSKENLFIKGYQATAVYREEEVEICWIEDDLLIHAVSNITKEEL